MDRGKRLSRGNVIGRQGELDFAKWALDQRLSANKAEVDLGVDFFCQVMVPVEGSLSLEGAGPTLSAQVKTVEENDKPRLKLDRIDATDLLRQTQATCLFGLLLSDKSVHFQFLTRDFIDELLRFLESKNQQFSISFGSMSSDPNLFQRLLKKYVNPFEQLQLRIHLIQGRIKTAIPGSDISIKSTDEDTVCEIYVPSASSAFAVDPSAREEVRLKVLREGVIDPRQAGVNLHPAILHALKETQSTRLKLAGVAAEKIKVAIRWQDKTAVERFLRHTYGTEIAYVHRAGLRLTMNTRAEKKPDGYVHAMESEIFLPSHPATLTGNTLLFFRLFQPGAVLSLRSDWELPLSSFGDSLENIGEAVDQLPDLCLALSLPRARLLLADLKNEEFARSVWLLQALLLKSIPIGELVRGFIVGPAADLPIEDVPTVPISIMVPLVLNWKDTGIVIWLDCNGDGFLHEGLLCGIRLRQQLSWRIEKTGRHEKSIYPELWVSKDWPAIQIGSEANGAQDWRFDPAHSLPLEAIVRKLPGNVQDGSN
jgi:hypothetical protein